MNDQQRRSFFLKPLWAIIVIFLISVFSQGCGTTKEKKLEKEGLTLIYRHQDQAGPSVKKLNLDHPVKISEEVFRNHLYSLQYEETFPAGKKRNIRFL